MPVDFKNPSPGIFAVAQWVMALVLPQLWYRLQLELRFNHWPGYFHIPQVWLKKKKEKNPSL